MATFAAFFVARGSRHDAVKLSGYLHLFVGVQVAVRVHRGLHLLVSEPLCNQQRGEARLHQQAGVAVPLRYNKDKRKNPVFSRVSAFVAAYSIPFPTLVASEKSVE